MTWLDAGEMPSDDVLGSYFVEALQLVKARGIFTARVLELRDARIVSVEDHGPITTAALDVAATGRWRVSAVFAADGRVRAVMAYRDPPGVSVRDAEPGDGAALARAVPPGAHRDPGPADVVRLRRGLPRGDGLCAGREVLIAEQDGEIVGLHGGAYHAVVLDGRSFDACYIRHTRIDARAQGSGVFSSLNGRLFERIRLNRDFNYSIVALGNDRMLATSPPCSAARHRTAASPSCAVTWLDRRRQASTIPSIDEAVTLLNDAHRSETMFLPHTAASLKDRLTTVPDYTPAHLLAAGSAVVGVRDHPVHVSVEDERWPRAPCRRPPSTQAADLMVATTSRHSWVVVHSARRRGSRGALDRRIRWARLPARRSRTSA